MYTSTGIKTAEHASLHFHFTMKRGYSGWVIKGQWREQMLPSDDYRQIWQYVDTHLTMDEASLYMVRLLNIANKSEREDTVGRFVLDGIRIGRLPTLFDCEDRFLKDESWADSPKVEQHRLSSYQQILEGVK